MRIAFLSLRDAPFSIESATQVPLGGSESALCYLAEALAQQGHKVFLLNGDQGFVHARGVDCLAANTQVVKKLQPLDALVVQNITGRAPILRPLLAAQTRLILWTGHTIGQPDVQPLHDVRERSAYDGFAFVSEWQRNQYLQHFGMDRARTAVLRNAIGPAFAGLFADGTSLVGQKARPPVLAYTSTPFRGLDLLLEVLPEIRRAVPGTRLKVFSSMQVYGLAPALDEAQYGHLYRQCRETEGVEYLGSVPQPKLAHELRSAAVLAYSNTYLETSCIAVLEAMAAGCWIVTGDLGALPETTAGFASLIHAAHSTRADYRREFVEAVVRILVQLSKFPAPEVETHLRRQVRYVNDSCTWPQRALQWAQWLGRIPCHGTETAQQDPGVSTGPAAVATVAELFTLAWQHHQAGNFAQAEQSYRQALQTDPTRADGWGCLGAACQAQGKLEQAEMSFRRAAQISPSNASANSCLAVVLAQQGKLEEAAASLQNALRIQPNDAQIHNNLGAVLARLGRTPEAVISYRQALKLRPDDPQARYNLGLALKAAGQNQDAIAEFQEAVRSQPDFAEAMGDLGNTLAELKDFAEAQKWLRQALLLRPTRADFHLNLGNALQRQGKLDEAVACYREALALNPHFAQAHNNLGTALQRLGQQNQAAGCYREAVRLVPNDADAQKNLGFVLQELGRVDEAVTSYRRALALNPASAETHLNLGSAMQSQGRLEEAAASYRRAILLKSDFAEAHNNLGLALVEMGRMDEAVACFRGAVLLNPSDAITHSNLAGRLKELGQTAEAVGFCRRAVQLEPGNAAFLSQLVALLQHLCLWDDLPDLAQRALDAVAGPAPSRSAAAVDPFAFLALPTSAVTDRQRAAGECARQWVERRLKLAAPGGDRLDRARVCQPRAKIAVAYLSSDFQEHAIAYLIAELIETHDRERFTVFGYSYGPEDNSPMRRRLARAFDQFVDLKASTFLEAAQRIQAEEVDILVDLNGYTAQARPQILALRPAPLQVNYLGYPGTMGAPFMDYILVDDFVVPQDQQPFFTEKLVHLPGCYQVNDSKREIATATPSRAECGLPDGGFVFCCFNTCYKITPEVFTVWMRLLQNVPNSALWLLEGNRFAPANLRKEAQARGVAPERLVFAPRLPLPRHLARHRLADLFLDTVPYNAHTTASDALWAGCPVLTIAGQTFPSRVAGSLLRAVGLPELITASLEEYEATALRLARDAQFLAGVRSRLAVNRETSPLFHGAEFARNLEEAYATMWKIYTSGEPARGFAVPSR